MSVALNDIFYKIRLNVHIFSLIVSLLIIFSVIFIVYKNFDKFTKLYFYNKIIFLSSLAIAISSHEIVAYNFTNKYGDSIIQF